MEDQKRDTPAPEYTVHSFDVDATVLRNWVDTSKVVLIEDNTQTINVPVPHKVGIDPKLGTLIEYLDATDTLFYFNTNRNTGDTRKNFSNVISGTSGTPAEEALDYFKKCLLSDMLREFVKRGVSDAKNISSRILSGYENVTNYKEIAEEAGVSSDRTYTEHLLELEGYISDQPLSEGMATKDYITHSPLAELESILDTATRPAERESKDRESFIKDKSKQIKFEIMASKIAASGKYPEGATIVIHHLDDSKDDSKDPKDDSKAVYENIKKNKTLTDGFSVPGYNYKFKVVPIAIDPKKDDKRHETFKQLAEQTGLKREAEDLLNRGIFSENSDNSDDLKNIRKDFACLKYLLFVRSELTSDQESQLGSLLEDFFNKYPHSQCPNNPQKTLLGDIYSQVFDRTNYLINFLTQNNTGETRIALLKFMNTPTFQKLPSGQQEDFISAVEANFPGFPKGLQGREYYYAFGDLRQQQPFRLWNWDHLNIFKWPGRILKAIPFAFGLVAKNPYTGNWLTRGLWRISLAIFSPVNSYHLSKSDRSVWPGVGSVVGSIALSVALAGGITSTYVYADAYLHLSKLVEKLGPVSDAFSKAAEFISFGPFSADFMAGFLTMLFFGAGITLSYGIGQVLTVAGNRLAKTGKPTEDLEPPEILDYPHGRTSTFTSTLKGLKEPLLPNPNLSSNKDPVTGSNPQPREEKHEYNPLTQALARETEGLFNTLSSPPLTTPPPTPASAPPTPASAPLFSPSFSSGTDK